MGDIKCIEFSEIATRAIFETLSPNRKEIGDYTKKAIQYASDSEFREIIAAIAKGFGLSVNRISHRVGIVLSVEDTSSPFSPGLTWLNHRLSNTKNASRDELHSLSVLTLTAVLSEAFPNPHSTGLEWSSPAQFNIEDVINKLYKISDEIVCHVGTLKNQNKKSPMLIAEMILENRIPKYPQKNPAKISFSRSQYELIKSWICLLEDHGLLIEERGYIESEKDTRWMATEKLKVYMGQAAIVPMVEKIMSILEKSDDIEKSNSNHFTHSVV